MEQQPAGARKLYDTIRAKHREGAYLPGSEDQRIVADVLTRRDVARFVEQQELGQLYSRRRNRKFDLHPTILTHPFQQMGLDISDMQNYPSISEDPEAGSYDEFKYILVCVDMFSKFGYARALRSRQREEVVVVAASSTRVAAIRTGMTGALEQVVVDDAPGRPPTLLGSSARAASEVRIAPKTYPFADRDTALRVAAKNPKKRGTASWDRYERYKTARTVGEFLDAGGTSGDLRHDWARGYVTQGAPSAGGDDTDDDFDELYSEVAAAAPAAADAAAAPAPAAAEDDWGSASFGMSSAAAPAPAAASAPAAAPAPAAASAAAPAAAEEPRFRVGDTVDVAPRTFPGINKAGGTGTITKVNDERQKDGGPMKDGSESRTTGFTYAVKYTISGSEKRVDAQWIARIDDEEEDASDGGAAETLRTPGGRVATVLERRARGWVYVELDGNANDEGGAHERKSFRNSQLASM